MATNTTLSDKTPTSKGGSSLFAMAMVGIMVLLIVVFFISSLYNTCKHPPGNQSGSNSSDEEAAVESTGPYSIEALNGAAAPITYGQWKERATDDSQPEHRIDDTSIICVICLETLQDADTIRFFQCNHVYHSDCVAKWYMKHHNTCPVCKKEFWHIPTS